VVRLFLWAGVTSGTLLLSDERVWVVVEWVTAVSGGRG
jgi:hypothetical protein